MPDPASNDRAESWTLDITASDSHVYDVSITHPSRATTTHRVSVPERLMSDLRLSAAQEPLLVRASLTYLLEHSPAAIPERFNLDEIGKAIPEYREEIVARV
jgi:hypothetical protein